MKKTKAFLILFMLLFQASCLEFTETTQFNSEGNPLFTINIQVPDIKEKKKEGAPKDQKLEKNVKGFFDAEPSAPLKVIKKEEKKNFGLQTFSVVVQADQLSDIKTLYQDFVKEKEEDSEKDKEKEKAFNDLFSKSSYTLKKTHKGTLLLTRAFTPPPKKTKEKPSSEKKGKEGGDNFSKELEEVFLNMVYFSFEFFSPSDVVTSNAQESFGRNLRWKTTLGYLLTHPFKMETEIQSTPELEKRVK